ncbi:MAG: serine/threonine protein kinase [Myxococcales bacterium]|nr:serine/threonine protein kinase [Myxococcales bacterium]
MTAPAQLGRYTLLRRLASGGMGEVYLAEARGAAHFTHKVAIKRILPHLAEDETFVRKFIDEAHLMVQLHHGNIVPVQELADHDGELYLVMQYLPGRDLKAVIRRLRADGRRMPVELALWLITEVLAGLDYAHRKLGPDGRPLHIVHRDVSPANVVLGAGGEVKLIDFGIARARGGLHRSISGTLQGKFVYMSPEQADGRPVDARSDVFSTGLLLYELLTGLRPFEAETETAVLRKVREAEIQPASQVADVPEALDALLAPALAREVDDRYDSAAAMRRALLHHLAVSDSRADAASFAQFLAELFPEGVIPDGGPTGPLSIDDALQMQLGALTPSARFDERTRTHTGDAPRGRSTPIGAVLAAYAETATADAPASQPPLTASGQTAPPPTPMGRRRLLFLGLALGAALTAGAFALRPTPQAAYVDVQVTPAADAKVVLGRDEAVLSPGTRLTAGQTERICAVAPGHQKQCQLVTLRAGRNRLTFTLVAVPRLAVVVQPPDARWTITVNDLPVDTWPYDGLAAGRLATVQIHPGDGWTVDGDDRQVIRVQSGANNVQFRLLPRRDAAVGDAGVSGSDAGVGEADDGPDRPRATPRRARVTLQATPTAQVACGGRALGATPQTVTAEGRPVQCVLSADGFADRSLTVHPRDGVAVRHVELDALARLTARALPAAAVIHLDGRPLGPNLVRQLPVPPGPHTLDARLERDGQTLRSAPLRVTLKPGQVVEEAYLLEVLLPQPQEAP